MMDSVLMSADSFFKRVTPIILTYNEAPNIRRSLSRLTCFDEVLVLDSGSSDQTLAMVEEFPNVRTMHRPFDSFSGQWNYALREGGVRTEWVLAMDADYILTDAFLDELSRLAPLPGTKGYRIAFDYCVFGKKLSATLYPPIVALHCHQDTHYIQDGHAMRAQVSGGIANMKSRIQHDDRKPLARWVASQSKYAEQECELLLSIPTRDLRIQDRLRRMIFIAPWLVPLYCMTVGRGALDGWAGMYYVLQRGVAEALLAIKLIEKKLLRGGN